MNTWKVVCATLVIFVAGIITGVVLVRIGERGNRIRPRPNPEFANRLPGNPNAVNDPAFANRPNTRVVESGPNNVANRDRDFLAQLDRQISLAPEQRRQIAQLLADGQERIRKLRQGIEPDIRRELQDTHERIQKLLTSEQQEQFRQLVRQRFRRDNANPEGERRPRDMRERRESRLTPPPVDEPEGPVPTDVPPGN